MKSLPGADARQVTDGVSARSRVADASAGAARATSTRSVVIVTYRDDEIGAGHPLRAVLGDLATPPDASGHFYR